MRVGMGRCTDLRKRYGSLNDPANRSSRVGAKGEEVHGGSYKEWCSAWLTRGILSVCLRRRYRHRASPILAPAFRIANWDGYWDFVEGPGPLSQ